MHMYASVHLNFPTIVFGISLSLSLSIHTYIYIYICLCVCFIRIFNTCMHSHMPSHRPWPYSQAATLA